MNDAIPSPPAGLSFRPAEKKDAAAMLRLINDYADRGMLLKRSEESLMQHLPDFSVAVISGEVVGCGALSQLGPGLGEIRSIAVRADQAGRGIGHLLVEHLYAQAEPRGFQEVLALTRRVNFFEKLGFEVSRRERFLDKLKVDCAACPMNLCCDETAVVKPVHAHSSDETHFIAGTPASGETTNVTAANDRNVKKVMLAYSGGLDTSIIIPWIKENYGGAEILGYCGDVGQGEDLEAVRKKAIATGASSCIVEDLRDEFVREYCFKAMQAGALYEGRYYMGTSLARPILALGQVRAALKENCDALAHGATGKGNDQVRFEVTYATFAPNLRVIAPWKEWNIRSREDAIDYAKAHDVPIEQTKKDIFSRDGNLWHLSHEGGNLEDPWSAPVPEMFKLSVEPEKGPDKPEELTIAFEKGVPVSIDGKKLAPVALVEELNRRGGAHGVGRLDMVEDRLVGMKARGVYETPGGTILYAAHRELESLCLDRQTIAIKNQLSFRYSELVYDGLWFSTLRKSLQAFVDFTQQEVTGEVRVRLYKGSITPVGRRSPRSLYREDLATFGEGMKYDHKDAEGFIRLFSLPERVRAMTRSEKA